jgi:hypothetical protein
MKTVMNKTRIVLVAFMLLFTVASSNSFAGTNDKGIVEFKYIGNTNNQPVFLLNLHNNDAGEFLITLKTQSGEVLYSEKVEGKQIARKYRLNTDEFDASAVNVEVVNRKDNSKVVYAVSIQTRVVNDVVVNKL